MHIENNSDRIVLFLHIPKCAGLSLSNILYWQLYSNEDYIYGHYFTNGIYHYPVGFFLKDLTHPIEDQISRIFLARNDLRAVLGHFYFGIHKKVIKPFTYITILRHPLERIFSLYKHLYTDNYPHHNCNFEEFIFKQQFIELFNDHTART